MRRIPLTALAAAVLLLSAASCPPTGSEAIRDEEPAPGTVERQGDIVAGTGTVRWYTFEGGFYAIAGDDGTTYDPINLADDFEHDGLRVRFRARLRNDLVSFHQAGPLVEVVEISRT